MNPDEGRKLSERVRSLALNADGEAIEAERRAKHRRSDHARKVDLMESDYWRNAAATLHAAAAELEEG